MSDDLRCCGSGACIVDPAGRCWCGQQWNGEAMCSPTAAAPDATAQRRDRDVQPQPDASTNTAPPES